jgi:uncharacterized membrane protein
MLTILRLILVLGLLLSLYSFYVERKITKNKKYSPVCDISSNVSCTKAFTSKYGHVFVVSNSLLGMGFYLVALLLAFSSLSSFIFYMALPSMLMTLYLAYVSFFVQKNFCLVCSTIYLVNLIILVLSSKLL